MTTKDRRQTVLDELRQALAAFVTEGIRDLPADAHKALAERLERGYVDVRLSICIEPFAAIVCQREGDGRMVELFRVVDEPKAN